MRFDLAINIMTVGEVWPSPLGGSVGMPSSNGRVCLIVYRKDRYFLLSRFASTRCSHGALMRKHNRARSSVLSR